MQQAVKSIIIATALSLAGTLVFSQTGVLTAYICYGEKVKIRANSPDAISYQWYRDGEVIDGITSDSFIATWGGLYSVEAIGDNGCSSMAMDMVNIIQNTPVANNDIASAVRNGETPIFILNNDSAACTSIDSATLSIVKVPLKGSLRSEGGLMYYQPYRLEEGVDSFTYHFADKDGTYSNTASVSITISNDAGAIVYPNPADDYVNIRILDERIIFWRLIDRNGRIFMEAPVTAKDLHINISQLEAAPYFFTFHTDGKVTYNMQVIKR